jgi:hypothetical protein
MVKETSSSSDQYIKYKTFLNLYPKNNKKISLQNQYNNLCYKILFVREFRFIRIQLS